MCVYGLCSKFYCYYFVVVYKLIGFKIILCWESWINEILIRLLDIYVILILKDFWMFWNSDFDCELDFYVSKLNKKKMYYFFCFW